MSSDEAFLEELLRALGAVKLEAIVVGSVAAVPLSHQWQLDWLYGN
jgi:hypothetical protein